MGPGTSAHGSKGCRASSAALGPLLFGFVVEGTSYSMAWLLCAGVALLAAAAILAGRAMVLRERTVPG
ncbi:MAG: hypothetical protein H0V83_15180 [Rubrobacter sp.]|nr:hypothetical protein [Rubrobacter sp.]